MGKKIIVKEEQYLRLLNRLVETEDVNDTLDYVNAGDVLLFKGVNNLNLKIKIVNVNQNSGEILGETEKGEKVKFSFNAYDENSKRFDFKRLDKNSNQYVNEPFEVKSMDIIRNNNILDIPVKREPIEPSIEPISEPKYDEPSKEIDFDPNIDDYKPKNKNELVFDAERAFEMIVNDPALKNAFYTKPKFMELLMAELSGKKALGSGIIPTLQLISKYQSNKINSKLGDAFISRLSASFKVLEKVVFEMPNQHLFTLTPEKTYTAVVQGFDYSQTNYDSKVLENVKSDFKIFVKEAVEGEKDVFKCDIQKYVVTPDGEIKVVGVREDVNILFFIGGGYQPNKQKTIIEPKNKNKYK